MRRFTTLFLIVLSLGVLVQAQDSEATALVYQTVNVRSGPGTQFDIVGQLRVGDQVTVLGRDNMQTGWLQIVLPDSDATGWVAFFTVTLRGYASALPIVEATSADEEQDPAQNSESPHVVSYGRVNLRSGPGITNDIVGQLDVDDEAQISARSNYHNDWLYVENDEVSGWVAYFTVTVHGRLDDIPVLVPDTVTGELVPPSTLVHANFNIQVHTRPTFTAPSVVVIPFETEISPVGISENGRWLYVMYEDKTGWAWAPLFDLTQEQRALIPIRPVPARNP